MFSLCCCFTQKIDVLKKKKDDLFKKQLKLENKKKFIHIFDIGNFKPCVVYYGNNDILTNENILNGLSSLCENPIHISIGFNPSRIILSHCKNNNVNIIKENSFYIMNLIEEENINDISKITQYHIYTAIQSYIYENKKYPKLIENTNDNSKADVILPT
jgi:hypothetical protein